MLKSDDIKLNSLEYKPNLQFICSLQWTMFASPGPDLGKDRQKGQVDTRAGYVFGGKTDLMVCTSAAR